MPIMFNTILREAGLSLTDVRLIRHKDKRAIRGRTPYELWRDNRPQFELYQSSQSIPNRKKLTAPYWAVFIVNLNDETMFAGVYAVRYRGLLEQDTPKPHMDGIDEAGSGDVYDLTLQDTLSDLIGRLFIDWGPGALAWVQYADRNNKPVTELRMAFQEPAFPGFATPHPLDRPSLRSLQTAGQAGVPCGPAFVHLHLSGWPPRRAARRRGAAGGEGLAHRGPARGSVADEQGGAALPAGAIGRGIFRGAECGDRMAISQR